jgi:DNA modification methylase
MKIRDIQIENADLFDFVPTLPDLSIDLLLTDPPYNVSVKQTSLPPTTRTGYNFGDWDFNFDIYKYLSLALPKVKKAALIYCGMKQIGIVHKALVEADFTFRRLLVTIKPSAIPVNLKVIYPSVLDYTVYATRNVVKTTFNLPPNKSYIPPYFYNTFVSKHWIHPTMKPPSIINQLIATHSNPGDLVADFCAGSGTTVYACDSLNRRFIGCEREPKYYDYIVKQLQKPTLDDFLKPEQNNSDGNLSDPKPTQDLLFEYETRKSRKP